jgi:tRNA (uracil-5-)-methyltransferase TRM9
MGNRIAPDEPGGVYNRIAASWYNYRHWSIFRVELEEMAQRWQRGKLLNLGCGHGADFLPFKDSFQLYGVDISPEMLRYGQKYAAKFRFSAELQVANVTQLPYHHLKRPEERAAAFRELRRVLRPGGEAFITVWNRWQPAFFFRGKEIMVPWRTRAETLYRYYYLFSYREVTRLARASGLTVLDVFPERAHRGRPRFFSRNICLLVKK